MFQVIDSRVQDLLIHLLSLFDFFKVFDHFVFIMNTLLHTLLYIDGRF